MLKKLIIFFGAFALSWLAQFLGIAPQGKAFFIIFLIIFILSTILLICCFSEYYEPKKIIIAGSMGFGCGLLVSWIISKLFPIDFYTSFQILILISFFLKK